jgi:5-methylcytosine-specific restriction endonuclease McrA
MRIEIILFLITALIVANIYTEGKYLKTLLSYKKYYQIAGIILAALFVYFLIKKNPANAKNIIMTSNDYIKYLPVDRNTTDMISPILDFTSKHSFSNGSSSSSEYNYPMVQVPNMRGTQQLTQSGKKGTKRSVSETKKKFVASRQNWKCGDCGQQLNAWFEVDHKIRLEYGGSNHVDNLVAMCRECHGKKTTIENL